VLAGAALGAVAVLARRLRRAAARRRRRRRAARHAAGLQEDAARRAASPPPPWLVSQQLETAGDADELRALRALRLRRPQQ
jgi:hypothetical protein